MTESANKPCEEGKKASEENVLQQEAPTSMADLEAILQQRAKDAAEKRNKEIEKDNLPLAQKFDFFQFGDLDDDDEDEDEDEEKIKTKKTLQRCWEKGMFLIMPRGAVGSCAYHLNHLGAMVDEHHGGGTSLGVILLHNLMYPIADAYRDIKDAKSKPQFLHRGVVRSFTYAIGATFAVLNLAEYLYDNDDPELYEAVWTYLGKTWKRLLPHLIPQKVLDQEGHDTLIRIIRHVHGLIDEDCSKVFRWKPTQDAYVVARNLAESPPAKTSKQEEMEKEAKEEKEREKQKRLASSNPILTIDERLEHLHNSEGKSLKEASTITGIKEGTLAKWRKQEEEMWFLSAIGRGDDTKIEQPEYLLHKSELIMGRY